MKYNYEVALKVSIEAQNEEKAARTLRLALPEVIDTFVICCCGISDCEYKLSSIENNYYFEKKDNAWQSD